MSELLAIAIFGDAFCRCGFDLEAVSRLIP